MEERPSKQLLRILRETATTRGWNTAALAKAASLPRAEMKRVLSGNSPLSVDTFALLAAALEINESDLIELGTSKETDADVQESDLSAVAHHEINDLPPIDPLGNHADQMLRLGFGLGCDMTLTLAKEPLTGAGFPQATLDRYPDHVPIRLDAAYHRHNDPRFLPEGIQLVLSFDSLCTVVIPWTAIRQVSLRPLHTELPKLNPKEPTDKTTHLRLVE